jgi:23S rRNA (cytosine1962-C5)-methyltransferase
MQGLLQGYELLATGDGKRLERWDGFIMLRPERAASWPWKDRSVLPPWDGCYHGDRATDGLWEWRRPLPDPCIIRQGSLGFLITPSASKHLGLFPEQSANWNWITGLIRGATKSAATPPRVLNLFGYTGGATLAAAAAGASVTHVDASRSMVSRCSGNARLSGLGEAPIRYIVEDAMTFLRRETRRGNRYDAIVMDPPSYGRGKDGQRWKLADHLPDLLEATLHLLSPEPLFLLLNTYSGELDDLAGVLFSRMLPPQKGFSESVPLGLTGCLDQQWLPLGMAHRWAC